MLKKYFDFPIVKIMKQDNFIKVYLLEHTDNGTYRHSDNMTYRCTRMGSSLFRRSTALLRSVLLNSMRENF